MGQGKTAAPDKRSPLLPKLPDHVLGGEVEVELGGGEAVMAQETLQGREGNTLLDGGDGEGVAQDVRRDLPSDPGLVGDLLDKALKGARTHAQGVVKGEVALD